MFGSLLIWAVDEASVQQLIAGLNLASPKLIEALTGIVSDHLAREIQAGAAGDAEKRKLPIAVHDNVAVVELAGPMYRRTSRQVRDALRAAAADPSIDQIVMRVSTPGGAVDGTDELAQEVAAVNAVKPVTAVVDGMCASAGYWVASQAGKIFASSRMNLIGSLGVRLMLNDFSGFFAQKGIKAIPIDTGELKSAGAFGTEITEAQQQYFRSLVDSMLAEFKGAVASGRQMSAERVDALFTGQVWPAKDLTGKADALSLGLIDGIQTMEATIAALYRPVQRGRSTASARARLALMEQDLS